MRLAKKTQYGLQILLQLAVSAKLVQAKDIAAEQNLNEPYVEQLLAALKRSGLVRTARGRRGGYRLARACGRVTLLDVIETFEGPLELTETADATAGNGNVHAQAAMMVWGSLTGLMRETSADITLETILARENYLMPDYVI